MIKEENNELIGRLMIKEKKKRIVRQADDKRTTKKNELFDRLMIKEPKKIESFGRLMIKEEKK